ncbi:porin family protein [Epilithonimonas sp.]|uniref:porin family protein n=1 Tax=Epilithonimonas sp. TaxID=2894511 RepID=UPI0028A048E8|nr:porin family protein [Epilithonimonas sp.]
MKKLIVIFSLLVFSSVSSQSIKYGVTGSFHKGSIAGIHNASKGNFGGSIGLFADFSIVPNDIYDSAWLYLTPQLELYAIGEKASWNEKDNNQQKYNNTYIGVPIYLKYFIRNSGYKGDLYFMIGPKFEFLVSEKNEEGDAVNKAMTAGYDPAKFGLGQKADSFGYGISAKVGVKVDDKLDVFIRFDRGLSKVYPDYVAQSSYNRFLAIGLSYYLGETN